MNIKRNRSIFRQNYCSYCFFPPLPQWIPITTGLDTVRTYNGIIFIRLCTRLNFALPVFTNRKIRILCFGAEYYIILSHSAHHRRTNGALFPPNRFVFFFTHKTVVNNPIGRHLYRVFYRNAINNNRADTASCYYYTNV